MAKRSNLWWIPLALLLLAALGALYIRARDGPTVGEIEASRPGPYDPGQKVSLSLRVISRSTVQYSWAAPDGGKYDAPTNASRTVLVVPGNGPVRVVCDVTIDGKTYTRELSLEVRSLSWDWERENDGTMGWELRGAAEKSAIVELRRKREQGRHSKASLGIHLNFEPSRQSGETAVDMTLAEAETSEPRDLSNRVVTGFVKFLRGFPSTRDHEPGAQLFLVDSEQRSLYGCWQNIEQVMVERELWIRLKLDANQKPGGCRGAEMGPGFDSTKIRAIGVKIAANVQDPIEKYEGWCYLDSVSITERTEQER